MTERPGGRAPWLGLRSGPALFLLAQLLILLLAWNILRHASDCQASRSAQAGGVLSLWRQQPTLEEAGGPDRAPQEQRQEPHDGDQQAQQLPAVGSPHVTTNLTEWMEAQGTPSSSTPHEELKVAASLTEWAATPDELAFQDPQSHCLLHPGGRVELPSGQSSTNGIPFLFDTASMPLRDTACPHCPKDEKVLLCCGVCIFEDRRCDTFYPNQGRSERVAQELKENGYQLQAFSPCELFARIRGRTLWFMGDSQTWHYYYAAECFLRNFAPSLRRTGPLPWEENKKLITVTWPVTVPPICLELALGTRVCAVRVDTAHNLMKVVLPFLKAKIPGFKNDLMIFNTGLHYGTPGADGKPPSASQLVTELKAFAAWRKQRRAELPKLVWMDVPVQHFSGPDGSYAGKSTKPGCRPLAAWDKGDLTVLAGGRRNIPLASLVPQFADAHLRTWNASVPLWDTHKPDHLGDCTHWCSPAAYQLWLFLLNDVLRDSQLGGQVELLSPAAAAAAGSGMQQGLQDR